MGKGSELTQEQVMLDLLEGMNGRLGWGGWYFTPDRQPGIGWTIRGDCERLGLHTSFAPPLLLIQEAVDPFYHYEKCYRDMKRLIDKVKEG